MHQGRSRNLAEKVALWSDWEGGLPMAAIGESLGRNAASVFGTVRAAGGHEPRVRRRSSRSLQWAKREEISRGLGRRPSSGAASGRLRL